MNMQLPTAEMLMGTIAYKTWRLLEWDRNAGTYQEIDDRFLEDPVYRREFEQWVEHFRKEPHA